MMTPEEIKALKLAMLVPSVVAPQFMWIGKQSAEVLGLPGSGAYERVDGRWIKRGEL